jgi:uncharacterized membrane protein YgcG
VSLRARTFFLAALAAGALLLTIWSSSAGASVPKLTGQITDEAGALGSDRARVQTSLDDLFETDGIRLWVVFVRSTNASRAPDIARQLFEENELSGHDLLLFIAVDDHRYGWWELTFGASDRGKATGLSAYEIDALLSAEMEPRFRVGDYAGGIVSLSRGLARATHEAHDPDPTTTNSGTIGGGDDSDLTLWLWLIPVLMAGGMLAIVAIAVMAGRAGSSSNGGWGGGGWSGSSGSGDWSSSGDSSASSSSGGFTSSDDSSGHGGGGGWADAGTNDSAGDSRESGHGGGGGW